MMNIGGENPMNIKLGKYALFILWSNMHKSYIITKNYKWQYKALRYLIYFTKDSNNSTRDIIYKNNLTIPYTIWYNKDHRQAKEACETYKRRNN